MKNTQFMAIVVLLFLLTDGYAKDDNVEPLANVAYQSILSLPSVEPDATLSYGFDPLQYGKLWLPEVNEKTGPSSPLVIFIHGGCWLSSFTIDHSFALTSALASKGFMVWSLEYRRSGDEGGGWPGSFDDINQGVRYILTQNTFEFDHNKIIIMGHSAGGHLALLTANQHSQISHTIGLAAITNLVEYARGSNSCQSATSQFMRGAPEDLADQYSSADPSQQPRPGNTVLLHGGEDKIVDLQQAENFGVRTIIVPAAGHFDWLHPQTKAFTVLVNQLEEIASAN